MAEITINPQGAEKLLSKLQPSKASGPDNNLPSCVLKGYSAELTLALICIFQKSLDAGYLPDDWKHANIKNNI